MVGPADSRPKLIDPCDGNVEGLRLDFVANQEVFRVVDRRDFVVVILLHRVAEVDEVEAPKRSTPDGTGRPGPH